MSAVTNEAPGVPILTISQGKGMLQGGKDYEIVTSIDEELSLRKLRAKVNGRAGIKDKHPPNRFSILAELCYHPKSIEVTRKDLDSGVLADYFAKVYADDDRCWDGYDYRRYHVLVACAMTLGCTIPNDVMQLMHTMQNPVYLKAMRERQSDWALPRLANQQLRKALAVYKAGTPYDFGNTTMLEASMAKMGLGTTTVKELGSRKVVELKLKSGQVIPHMVGPPADEEIGLKTIYANHLCAECGAASKDGGQELDRCASCKDRKYCNKGCQKRHWKMHKIICTRPADQMAKFLASIQPIDFGGKQAVGAAGMGGSAGMAGGPVMMMS